MNAPLLLVGIVTAQNAEDHSVQCAFRSTGQQPGFPVRMGYDGLADAVRIHQKPLPSVGTWGLIANPYGDLRNCLWLKSYYPSNLDAVTTDANSPFTTYDSEWSGFWKLLDDQGQLAMQFPDGSSVQVSSETTLPTTYRHTVDQNGAKTRVPFTQAERVPSKPSPFLVTVNLASGAKITVDQEGNTTYALPGSAAFGVTQGGAGLVDALALVSKTVTAFNAHVHSGGGAGVPTVPWTPSTIESTAVLASN